MRKFLITAAVLVALIVGVGLYFARQAAELGVEAVTEDVAMITGFGGNVGVVRTGAGTVIIDTMTFQFQGDAIREQAEALTGEPVVMIVNTHYHSDHTHGNPAFAASTRVVATDRTAEYLREFDADYWAGEAAALLPNETFGHERTIRIGGKTVRLLHPGRGHTGGDLVAWIEEDNVLHMGDLYFNRLYPNIDLEAGGSVREWSGALDVVMAAFPGARIIPGHGPLSDEQGLRGFQAFITELAAVGQDAAAAGKSLDETLRDADLTADAGYEPLFEVPLIGGLNREFVITRAWEEATGAVQ
ncbi:MAG: MBL fold metallo-hydrolase [Gammaproteobacteria bacterium]|nr:MBL fold metallo-hydrolase [Gammaproteobacteria bacterium]MDE0273157.1 MBL fold metallo-hydrolase [Gammaproteobacteria bacterium]